MTFDAHKNLRLHRYILVLHLHALGHHVCLYQHPKLLFKGRFLYLGSFSFGELPVEVSTSKWFWPSMDLIDATSKSGFIECMKLYRFR